MQGVFLVAILGFPLTEAKKLLNTRRFKKGSVSPEEEYSPGFHFMVEMEFNN